MQELRFIEGQTFISISVVDTDDCVTISMDREDDDFGYNSMVFKKQHLVDIIKWLTEQVKMMD